LEETGKGREGKRETRGVKAKGSEKNEMLLEPSTLLRIERQRDPCAGEERKKECPMTAKQK